MDYDSFPPSNAILRIQDWQESMQKDEPDHSLLVDVVSACSWPPRIRSVRSLGRHFEHGIEFELPKPSQNREGHIGHSTSLKIDPEGFGLLLIYALAGAIIRQAPRGDGKFHYLALDFPREPPISVHRLLIDAAQDQDAKLPDHHDYRRRSLGQTLTVQQQRTRHGVDRVKLAPRETRQSALARSVAHLHTSHMSRFIPEEEYRAMLGFAYGCLEEIPLGHAEELTE